MYRTLILLPFILSLLLVNSFAASADDYKFKITFKSTEGIVIFDHESHAYGRVKDCAICHSALKTFGGEVNELFAHNFCKTCHESNNAPTECNGCHKKEAAHE